MKGILAILMAGMMMAVMIAPAMGDSATSSATVGNADPVVSSVVVTNPTSMNPCPATTDVTVTATVSDANGVGDITSVEITVSPDIGVGTITMTTSTTTGTVAEYTGTISLPCCTAAADYTVTVTATDSASSTHFSTDILTVPTLKGLSLNFDKVSFSGAPGANDVAGTAMSGASTIDPTVKSVGNTAIDISVLAGDLAKDPDTITGGNMEANIDTIGWQAVGSAYTFVKALECQSTAVPAFRLDIPSGTPHGIYTGSLTISAV